MPEPTYAPALYAEFQIACTPAQKPAGAGVGVGAGAGAPVGVGVGVGVGGVGAGGVTISSFFSVHYINLSLLLLLINGLF